MVDLIENFFKVNTWYSLTLNPPNKHQFLGHVDRFKRFRNFCYENLFILKSYEMFIEISEPRGFHIKGYEGPRLHLHGRVRFNSNKELAQFLLNGYYKLLRWSSVDIDTINDADTWSAYCTKQHLFKKARLSSFMLDVKSP